MTPERVGWKTTKLYTLTVCSPRSQPLGSGTARNLTKTYLPNMQEAPLHPEFGRFSTKLEVVRKGLTSREVVIRAEALLLCFTSLASAAGETLN